MTTVYAVASAKGGVGKTTTTAAIATILADSGADVVAIDADIGMANLAGTVGVTPGETTLHDVLAGRADPLDAVHDGPAGLRVVPGATDLDAYAAADTSELRAVVDAFDDADYVFIDAGAGLSHDSTLPLGLADATLLVSTAERNALVDTEKTRQLTERLGGTIAGVAITRAGADIETEDDVTRTLDAPVLARIPEDPAVLRASKANEPLPAFAPDAPATRAYRDLARALTGAEIETLAPPEGDDDATDDARDDVTDDARDDVTDDARDDATDDARDDARDDATDDDSPGDSPGDARERAVERDPEAAPADEGAPADEDIIVADSEPAGLGEEGDEEDIIVAAESPVSEAEEVDSGSESPESENESPESGSESPESESESPVSGSEDEGTRDGPGGVDDPEPVDDTGIDGDTKTVGEDHVDADDLESMIEEDLGDDGAFDGESEPFDGDAESADDGSIAGDESVEDANTDDLDEADASTDDRADAEETGVGDSAETDIADIDDELAGSVPFRDDDTGTMNTALAEERSNETDSEGDESGDESGDDRSDDENGDGGSDGDGGFFSRLLGR
ncbi:P-loop NTPase [Halorubrum trueperi]|uniref:P-loop NTPase n=1 Tax=Halorubrum trueperi TaxID=2004704 RepID=A0ABD5UJN7_9EURY